MSVIRSSKQAVLDFVLPLFSAVPDKSSGPLQHLRLAAYMYASVSRDRYHLVILQASIAVTSRVSA